MKIQCKCTIPEETFIEFLYNVILEVYEDSHHYINKGKYNCMCDQCGACYFIDTRYEDMMFDLRSMNTIW